MERAPEITSHARHRVAIMGAVVVVIGAIGSATLAGQSSRPAPPPADPAQVNSLTPQLDGFHWGMTPQQIGDAHARIGGIIWADYDKLLKKDSPGSPDQRAHEAQRDASIGAFGQSFIYFVTPVGYDSTGLHSEYTYGNHEAVMSIEREGRRRFFFFIGVTDANTRNSGRLWKIYDEYRLVDGGVMGKTFGDMVNKIYAQLGVAGRVRQADPSQNLEFSVVDWKDGVSHYRVIDRSNEGIGAASLAELSTIANLANLRSHKQDDPLAMDPSVAAATQGDRSNPNSARPGASGSASATGRRGH